jgi:hypothetical protein
MEQKIKRFMIIFVILALFIGISVIMAVAEDEEAPPSPPNDQFGGGGGGGGSSYTPPAFEAYTKPLKSSDGTVIGQFEGQNFNSVMVQAEKNGTAGNATYALMVEGELSSQPPDDCWLDINFMEPDSARVPPGMDGMQVLGVINITKNPGDWSYKSGSPKYTLKISGPALNINPDNPYYLVRSDGTNYQVLKISIDTSGNEVSIKFNPQGDAGTFTIINAVVVTPTPTPTPVSTPTPTPTPVPGNAGIWGFPIFIAIFAIGAIAGAAVLYILNIHK